MSRATSGFVRGVARGFGVAVAALVAIACAVPPLAAQDGVGFRASIGPDTVYVGQQASYVLTVTIPSDVRQRLRRNPVFIPPEARAMLAYDLPLAKSDPTREGTETHTFRRALFPLTPGRYQIPPSQLTYALPQSASFFSREDEHSLRSDAVSLVAIDPPMAGRPDRWLGAVGRWRATARSDAREGRVGDPLVLTLRVDGTGNATLLPRPQIAIAWADVVAADERVTLDSTPLALGGAKEFTWLVTPRSTGNLVVPALDYSYFDPATRRYEVARSAPIALRVRAGEAVRVERRRTAAAQDSLLALRPALEGARPIALPAASIWLWIALLAPVPWVFAAWRSRQPRRSREPTLAERLTAPTAAAPGTLRALFDAALRERTGVRLEHVTTRGALSAALRREGVTTETANDAEHLRDTLDAGAYSKVGRAGDLRERVKSMLQRIGAEARHRTTMLLLVLAVPAAPGAGPARPAPAEPTAPAEPAAQGSDEAFVAFTEGQTAFTGRDFMRARDAFLRAARAAPRDPAAWANLGTAAWHAADTASAVLGWQRALRLDPLASDLRARLARVRAPQDRGAARVWPVPPLPLAILAFALWWGAWLLLARRVRSGRVGVRWILLSPALLVIGFAAAIEYRLRATDLAVIATPAPLRSLPALGSEAGAVPLVGEVVTVRERRGVWMRIALEAGREGWYPVERTYALARD